MPNKFESNKKYFTASIYAIIVIAISACIFKSLISWSTTSNIIKTLLKSLSPFLMGFFIAFIMNSIVRFFEEKVFTFIKHPRVKFFVSILISYIIVLGFCISTIVFVVPQIFESLSELVIAIKDFAPEFGQKITHLSKDYPDLNLEYLNNIVNETLPNIATMLQDLVTTLVPALYGIGISIVSWVLNIVIAFMVSCYMIIDKKHLILNARRTIYAILPKEKAATLILRIKESSNIFNKFIIGKSIDSLIIGLLCFVLMTLLDLEYAVLISLFVGVTNLIPYFGPFIGAIPGILILIMVSPRHAIEFAILILILQQFDGLYLGPKILGDSIGLRPLWIIFAISLGGWLAGPIGMFLGVPLIAVIGYLMEIWIDERLASKNITTLTKPKIPALDNDATKDSVNKKG